MDSSDVVYLTDLDRREDFLKPIPGYFGRTLGDTQVEENAKRWLLMPNYYVDLGMPQPDDTHGVKSAKNMLWRKVYVRGYDNRRYFFDDPYLAVAGIIYNMPRRSVLEYYIYFALLSSMNENGELDTDEVWRYAAGNDILPRRARFMWTIALLLKMGLLRYIVSPETEKKWAELEEEMKDEGEKQWLLMDAYLKELDEERAETQS